MPNWVTNKVRVIPNSKGASFEKVAKYVRGAETVKDVDGRTEIELEFDFNKLIPMPENVYRDDLPSDWKPTEQFPFNWYDWSNEHWNTKWNACNAHVNEEMEMFIFDTALSHPFPVIKALSERFPNNVFDVCFADEGIEENSGVYRIQAGEIA